MKDDHVMALMVVGVVITVGLFAFLAYLKKEIEPTSQTTPSQTVYIPQHSQIKEPMKTQESPPKTADILNHHLNEANRWYEIKLDRNLLTWQIRARQNVDILYSYSPTHATYFTLRSGEVLGADVSPNKDINAVYVMSATAGTIIELEFWKR